MKGKITTWYRLGLTNVVTVIFYRILKKLGYYRFILPITKLADTPFFSNAVADRGDKYKVDYFSFHTIQVSSPPNWFLNPWNKESVSLHKRAKKGGGVLLKHWSEIPDFTPDIGDIKLIWELSRFDWLPKMALAYQQGDNTLPLLELWLRDWVKHNPVNTGINWKCGQEASFRCLNLLVASLMIDDAFEKPSLGVLAFLEAHVKRIVPTLRYAMAQDNNHGTSEAAALFVVGEYLTLHGNAKQKIAGKKWAKKGRYWLENRVKKLVMSDGSFSQYSTTYHRLLLDSISFVELIKTKLGANNFSPSFYKKMALAVNWLYYMIDHKSGGAPNLGANDGAYLFNLSNNEYRDFRPSVQLGAAVFLKKSPCYENQKQHPLLTVFEIDEDSLTSMDEKASLKIMPNGGYVILTTPNSFALMRLPIYTFRPSHADALHIDFWLNGKNVLSDDGSYSYNTDKDIAKHFGGTASHNTIQFDDRDQMPRLSRFLFGSWLNSKHIESLVKNNSNATSAITSYTDYMGASHRREVILDASKLIVIDHVSGFNGKAIMRWRLPQGEWHKQGAIINNGSHKLKVTCDAPLVHFKITNSWNSRYYMEKEQLQVLEVEIDKKAKLRTEYSWI